MANSFASQNCTKFMEAHYYCPTMSQESQINLIMSVRCHIYILRHSAFPAGNPMMSATLLFTLPLRPPHKRSHAAAPNPLCCPSTSHTDPANTTARYSKALASVRNLACFTNRSGTDVAPEPLGLFSFASPANVKNS